VNPRQRLAIAHPMARATDSVSEFMHVLAVGEVEISSILTVNK
jgi:hypothetical protein